MQIGLSITLLLIVALVTPASCIQISLEQQQTCLDYMVSGPSLKLFYFHYSHNIDNVNMVLYYHNVKEVWHQTGFGIEYKHIVEVQYEKEGNYTMCFVKRSSGVADVSFEIVDQEDMGAYAGKEQLARLSRRISQFLMDIKRVGWSFKQVLEQHNSRNQTIRRQQNNYGYLLALKTVVMVLVVGVQVLVVKKLFK